jgi:transposase
LSQMIPNPGHHLSSVMLIGAKPLGVRNQEPFAVLRVTPSIDPDLV